MIQEYVKLYEKIGIENESSYRIPTSYKNSRNGTPEGIRTPDLLVRSQTLYPTELRVQS